MKNKIQKSSEQNNKIIKNEHYNPNLPENSAFWYDRDKNLFYRIHDESIDELIINDRYQKIVNADWDPRMI